MAFNTSNLVTAGVGAITSPEDFLLFSQAVTEIIELSGVVDQYPEEKHTGSVTKTKYPIETGASLTDNAVVDPSKLVLTAYVSSVSVPFGSPLVGQNRDVEAWQKIEAKRQQRELVTVVTLLKTYTSMLITNIATGKNTDAPRGNLIATITLEESLIAETQSTSLPQPTLTGIAADKPSTVQRGDVQSPTAAVAESSSILAKIVG